MSKASPDSGGWLAELLKAFEGIIGAVQSLLGFLALVVLCITVVLGYVLYAGGPNPLVLGCFVASILALVALAAYLTIVHPGRLEGNPTPTSDSHSNPQESSTGDTERFENRQQLRNYRNSPQVAGDDQPPAEPSAWYDELLPVLDEAVHYTAPTYFLDTSLRILDWNIAFELIFGEAVSKLRGQHVKHLIARLDNFDDVIAHADQFTRNAQRNHIPYVDLEPLRFRSARYGLATFAKVATQIHDSEGRPRGWAVALLIQQIDWEPFLKDLERECKESKLWSVYASSYDHVLTEFPPYQQLIQDVISVVPRPACQVADLGAGTGNVTQALLSGGHRVTAVEQNPGMLGRLRMKDLPAGRVHVVRSSVERLRCLGEQSFDAVVMVNVLYAVNDPLQCLQEVARLLRPGGTLAFSATHSETRLDPLLDAIEHWLIESGRYERLKHDYEVVRKSNKQIERDIARRHTRDEYRQWVEHAGFDIIKDVPDTYERAVMLIHARKR
ncbi:MAG: methyltransferase domain-containing protein [Pirellulaceae bacterium]|nr:methyltransferase domain-containing protein [Pirellulaceae bacterium]